MRLPKPKTVRVDCDTCGLDWSKHKPDAKGVVRLDECVRLLKNALAMAPTVTVPPRQYVTGGMQQYTTSGNLRPFGGQTTPPVFYPGVNPSI